MCYNLLIFVLLYQCIIACNANDATQSWKDKKTKYFRVLRNLSISLNGRHLDHKSLQEESLIFIY